MREYEVMVAGIRHTVQATESEAKARGWKPVAPPAVKAKTPRNKKV